MRSSPNKMNCNTRHHTTYPTQPIHLRGPHLSSPHCDTDITPSSSPNITIIEPYVIPPLTSSRTWGSLLAPKLISHGMMSGRGARQDVRVWLGAGPLDRWWGTERQGMCRGFVCRETTCRLGMQGDDGYVEMRRKVPVRVWESKLSVGICGDWRWWRDLFCLRKTIESRAYMRLTKTLGCCHCNTS